MAKEVCMVKGVCGEGRHACQRGMHDREGVWHRGAWQWCVHGSGVCMAGGIHGRGGVCVAGGGGMHGRRDGHCS